MRGILNFEEKLDLIDQCMVETLDINSGMFSQFVLQAGNGRVNEVMMRIENSSNYLEEGFSILREMENNSEITHANAVYLKAVLTCYQVNPYDLVATRDCLATLALQIEQDASLRSEDKRLLKQVISISSSSTEYWEEHLHTMKTRGMPWYVKDCVGATTAFQIGAVAYAAALFPGWGGAIALIGCAAFASAV